MEARLADKLKQINSLRSKILELIYKQLPKNIIESSAIFHSVLVTSTILVIIAVFATTRSLSLFSLHPVCMTIGVLIFLAEGIVSYKNDSLLEAFSPIMQHTKKAKSRAIHQAMQITGSCFLLFGLLLIVSNKLEYQHSIMPTSIHSLIGMVTITLLLCQAIVGQQKYDQIDFQSNSKIRRWHGDAGLLVWDLLCLSLLTGTMSFLPFTFTSLIVELCILTSWLAVHTQMSGGMARPTTKLDGDSYGGVSAASDSRDATGTGEEIGVGSSVMNGSGEETQSLIHQQHRQQQDDFDNNA